jgi:hypothetical protein
MHLMKLSVRIPLGLSIAVTIVGIIVFSHFSKGPGPFPTTYFIIWIVVDVILIAITIYSWLRSRKKSD